MEEKKMSLREKLVGIHKDLHSGKDCWNEEGGFAYRTFEGILADMKPLEERYRVALVVTDDIVMMAPGEVYVKAVATLLDLDSEETVYSVGWAREDRSRSDQWAAQMTGTASSYARKYACAALLALDNAQADPDSMGRPRGKTAAAPAPKAESKPAAAEERPAAQTAAPDVMERVAALDARMRGADPPVPLAALASLKGAKTRADVAARIDAAEKELDELLALRSDAAECLDPAAKETAPDGPDAALMERVTTLDARMRSADPAVPLAALVSLKGAKTRADVAARIEAAEKELDELLALRSEVLDSFSMFERETGRPWSEIEGAARYASLTAEELRAIRETVYGEVDNGLPFK